MDPLLGAAGSLLERAMRFRQARQAVLAGNVANAETPGYRRRDLSFDAALQESTRALERTDARHLAGDGGPSGYRTELGPRGTRPDGNGVDLDREIVQAHRNAGAFSDQASVLARLSTLMRTAISGR